MRLINIIRRFIPEKPKPTLGRWNIEQCYVKTGKKVDWSNEDHCGPCGESELLSIPIAKEIKKKPQN